MILCMKRAWENGWKSQEGGKDEVIYSWVGGLREHLNKLALQWLGGFGECHCCPGIGRGCWRVGWEERWCYGVLTAMEMAGEHGAGCHGGGTAGCQTELTNHIIPM
jgi:hypothetical protein